MYYNAYDCETCCRVFGSQHAASQHMNAFDHWAPTFECETCTREFPNQYAANQHMSALDHWSYPYECDWCSNVYRFEHAVEGHMEECRSRPRYKCDTCNAIYSKESDARKHMDQRDHWDRGYYCSACNRNFQNENNLKMHLRSHVHHGRTIACPFCRTTFTTASGVANHLESSSCPSARVLSRPMIYAELRKRDPQGLVTKKLLTYPNSGGSKIIATQATFNGSSYECYLCHRCFGSIMSLENHLNSPTHEQKLYHCPSRKKCGKEFVSLAGLFNHLESESCGFMRFDKVGKNVGGFLNPNNKKLIGFT